MYRLWMGGKGVRMGIGLLVFSFWYQLVFKGKPSSDDLGLYDQSQNRETEPLEMRSESEVIEVAKLFSSRYGQLTDRRQESSSSDSC